MEKVIIIGGSAGSFKVVSKILASLKQDHRFSFVVCLHRLRNVRSGFAEALSINSKIPVTEPFDKDIIRPGHVYLAPANYHLMFEYGYTFSLSVDAPVNHSRPSIDICMETASEVLQSKTIGILLSGANADGAAGLARIAAKGGTTIVQDPEEAEINVMPLSAIRLFNPDHILNTGKIITFIRQL